MRILIVSLTSITVLVFFFWLRHQSADSNDSLIERQNSDPLPKEIVESHRTSPLVRDFSFSPMAASLGNENGTIESDLEALHDIFRYTTLEPRGQIPTGTNKEITRALTTPNELGIASLPQDHPSISAKGELMDRWKTPYFFHALSSQKMEIRSAGPDRLMFTEDDFVEPKQDDKPDRPTAHVHEIDLGL